MTRFCALSRSLVLAAALAAGPASAQDFLGGLLRSAAENAASRVVDGAVNSMTAPRPAPPVRPAPHREPEPPQGSAEPAPTPPGDPETPSGARPTEARRQQAVRDSYAAARNSVPAEGPGNGWYEINPSLTRQQNCDAMLAAGQMVRREVRNPCRRD